MELETKRLILRKPQKSDWKDVVEGAGEYDVAKMVLGKEIGDSHHCLYFRQVI